MDDYQHSNVMVMGAVSDEVHGLILLPKIQTAGWFIQKQQLGLLGNSSCQNHFLLFAARELVHIPQTTLLHAHGPKGVFRLIVVNGGGPPFHVGLAAQQHGVKHGRAGQLIFLGHIGDLQGQLVSCFF